MFVTPEQTVDECMSILTNNRIRHLPVMQNHRVVGVLSIGDLVKWIVSEHEATIETLHQYISASYPG
jgi:CBS domain-containing protein